jgi:hypothetical protein
MYKRAGGVLRADLFTAGGQHVEPEAIRGQTATPALTAEVGMMVDALGAADCIPLDLDRIAGFDETTYRTRLATSTAYEVAVSGGGLPAPVYRWSFVTSRYRTFAEHVADMRELPWPERLPAAVDWAAVAGLLGPAADRGAEDEAWRAIWTGELGYPLRVLPERPEVSILWSDVAGFEARALSVVSPEPLFATERTELALRRKRVRIVMTPSGPRTTVTWPAVAHRLVRSQDGARALLVGVDPAGQPVALAPGSYRLEARYRLTGVAGLPDLSRQGDSSDETATWPFTVPASPSPLVDAEA